MSETEDESRDGGAGFFGRAYGVDDTDATRALYRDWAAGYDDDLREAGYASPKRVAEAMAAHVSDKTAPLLDLGCGTGLSGEALRAAGFTTIDGTDFSKEMLAIAERKGIYRRLFAGDLNDPIPAEPEAYRNVAAIGVFSPGHAPAMMVDMVAALLPAGGCFGFTLNDHALAEEVYEDRVNALCDDGTLEVVVKDYGAHLPTERVQALVYVVRKR